jgi:trk system potassium uptake protein TrkH
LNLGLVARFVSVTTGSLSAFMLFPALWGAAAGDGGLRPLLYSFAAGLAVTAALFGVGRREKFGDMNAREAILSVVCSWSAASALTGLPYLASGAAPSFLDALFEGVSGFTTTGATVLSSLDGIPRSILLWRSFSQWFGGIGIVVLTLAFFPVSGAGMRLYRAGVTGPFQERLTPRIQETAAFLCKIYLALTLAEVAVLTVAGLDAFDALTLSFSTMATGGFSPYRENVGHFAGGLVRWVTAIFLFLSATNLTLFHAILIKRDASSVRENRELRFYVMTMLSFGAAVSLILYAQGVYGSPAKAMAEGFFHTVSMLSTCGFFTADYSAWPAAARLLLLALMFCGGCAISTAGGLTCARVLVILRHVGAECSRRAQPRAIIPTRIGSEPIENDTVMSCFSYFAAYMGVFVVGFALLGLFGQDMTTAISGVAATLGNVGPGFGMAGPGEGYAAAPAAVKCVYMFLMFCGRLEIFTLFVIFTPKFWRD